MKGTALIDIGAGVPSEAAALEYLAIDVNAAPRNAAGERDLNDIERARSLADKDVAMARIKQSTTPLLILGRDHGGLFDHHGDQVESLMHNKFLIIDGSEVWTGSMNMTVNGAYRHLNNLVRIRSSLVAQNYSAEFEEMFLDGLFGENIHKNTPHPILTIDGIKVETYFSPDDSTEDRILELIHNAHNSVDFLYYSFTSDPIADALLNKAEQGIVVRGVVDLYQEGAGLGGEYQRLKDNDIDVLLDGHPNKMHHKVIIIDDQIVITGSYNLTRSAETKNDENTLIIHNPEFASVYLREFEWIYNEGRTE